MKLSPSILKSTTFRPGKPSGIFCTQCGTPNTRDSKFCKECGESLVTTYAPKISSDPFVQAGLGREDQIERLLDMAFWHNEAGNIGAALLACQAALALNDRCVTAWSLIGCLYEKKGELDKAIEAFEVVTALNPESMADAQKLEALRRGVHVKAVPQPASYRWVPPAMARFVQERPSAPAIGAAGAALAVLVLGLVAIRPLFSADNRYSATYTSNLSANRSAWSNGTPGSVAQDISPEVAMSPSRVTGASILPPASAAAPTIAPPAAPASRDPFAGPSSGYVSPTSTPKHSSEGRQEASAAPLPPLGLKGVPSASDVEPLPAAADGQSPVSAVVASVPEHTVPVTTLSNDQPSPGTTDSLPGDNGAPPPAPRISITIHGSPAGNGDGSTQVPPDNGPTEQHLVLTQGSGAMLQQQALTYQEQGDYSHAQAAYRRAISAYKSDLDAGRDSDAAVRGIQACETGLQICRQSQ